MAETPTDGHALKKYDDGDNPGAANLNFNWDTIDLLLLGRGTSDPGSYPVGGLFLRTDLVPVEIRQNTGTVGTPVWTTVMTGAADIIAKIDAQEAARREPTGFVDRAASAMSFVPGTRTFTIQPTGGSFDYYSNGTKYTKSSPENIVISNTDGIHFIYYDGATLSETTSFMDSLVLGPHVFVATIYWNITQTNNVLFTEERHGMVMDNISHLYHHSTVGTKFEQGLTLGNFTTVGDGSADAHAQMSIEDGIIWDEDIEFNITDDTPQDLDPILNAPVVYKLGTADLWYKDAATAFPVKQGTARIQWNNKSGPTWLAQDAQEGYYVAMWLMSSPDIENPVVAIMGQREDATLTDARVNNSFGDLDLVNFPSNESKVLYCLIFQTSSGYANTPKARLVEVEDLRGINDRVAATFDGAPASSIQTSTTSFDNKLSGADDNVQKALDTLDDAIDLPVTTIVSGTGLITTVSASDVIVSGTSIVLAAGTYILSFSASVWDSSNNQDLWLSFYKNGVQDPSTERQTTMPTNHRDEVTVQAKFSVNGAQAIDIRWRVSGGTGSMQYRSMIITRVKP